VPSRVAASKSLPTSDAVVTLTNEHRPLRFSADRPIRSFDATAQRRTCFGRTTKSVESGLLERARCGDRSAFDELSERCRTRLLTIARRILRNEADAEDSVQDSLVNVFVNMRRFDGRSAFFTWATRITINCCLMKLRSRRKYYQRRVDSETADEGFEEISCSALNPEEAASQDEENKLLREAIDALPERLRLVVEIKEFQDRSMQETASRLGISVGAAKARLFRARGLLTGRLSSKCGPRGQRILRSRCVISSTR